MVFKNKTISTRRLKICHVKQQRINAAAVRVGKDVLPPVLVISPRELKRHLNETIGADP